ncbi:hypothetical protein IC608_06780 [Devosia sp. PTR5]|uniref:Uncharacterized protein n=1 Tax=Devosia oryzisoli TaxID=2774138 RepID=A0A927FUL3_9HYPH|nr:hypothetical protein [Devosia oryzisoli]MBD8065173.1 hypothetical protein [Devosia oryzisoli]
MSFRKLTSLILMVLVLASVMLAAPVSANAAHVLSSATMIEDLESHGDSHAGDVSDAHDSIEHAHDVPCGLPIWALSTPDLPQSFLVSLLDTFTERAPPGLERPPRQVL